MIIKINSPKINCEGCKKNITKALKKLKGVKIQSIDLTTKDVVVDYDPKKLNVEDILAKLASINYPSSLVA